MIDQSKTDFQFLDKLYGREEHLEQLIQLYHDMASRDNSLVFIKGVSGMGKSSLAIEFGLEQKKNGAYFVRGKQDLSRNNPPYATIIQAFGRLIEYWLDEPEEERELIRNVLQRELGAHHSVLMDAFPRLVNLFGKGDKIDYVSHLNFKDRFNEALLSFTNALGHIKNRIIILLDDLQWVDYATVQFLKLWLSEGKASNVFWLGTFRDDEVKNTNWLLNNQSSLNKNRDNITTIKLTGFSLDVINQMITDVIVVRSGKLVEFSEFVFQLTGGNPLYIKESLPMLLHDEVLFFDEQFECWDYDTSRIKKIDKSSRTLEFIIRKMEGLSDDARSLLGIGSAIGEKFNSAILSAVSERNAEAVATELSLAEQKGMIECISPDLESPGTKLYRFTHDKMQNAAYLLMSEERRKAVHFALGKTYASSLGYAAEDRNIYDIVNQYNRCASYFDSDRDRIILVEMNMNAGKKAKASSSFNQALDYFSNVIHIIESNDQDWDANLIFDVYLEAGEAAYLKSDFVSSVMFYESALKYAGTNFQKAQVHHNFLVMYNGVSDMDAAWKSGMKALELLGQDFPARVGKIKVIRAFFKSKLLLRKVGADNLLDRPNISDPEAEQLLLTLMEMIPAAWGRKPEVLGYIVLKGFDIVLKNGNTPIGYFAVSGYGAIMGMAFGKIEEGWKFIKLGGALTQRYDNMIFHGRGSFGVYATYSHLIFHSRHNIEPLEDAYSFSKGAGDYSVASYSSIILVENMFAIGTHLEEIAEKARSYFKFLERTSNCDYLTSHKSVVTASKILTEGYDDHVEGVEQIERCMKKVNFHHIVYTWSLYHLVCLVVYNKKEAAAKQADDILREGYNALSSVELVNMVFLSIAVADGVKDNKGKRKALKYLKAVKKQVLKSVKINPANYGQINALVMGLIEEVKGKRKSAIRYYRKAVKFANKYEFVHYEAVFTERLANLLSADGELTEGEQLMDRARVAYESWGASGKALHMQQVGTGV